MSNQVQVQSVTVFALIIYALILVCIGIYSAKRVNNIDGFLLANRKIGPWMSAFAYGTSYFSAVIFIGYAGKNGWDYGLGSMFIGVGNAVIGALLGWLLFAQRTRRMTHKLDAKTMPQFFAKRYQSEAMKIYAAFIIFLFLVPYSAAVYKGLGSLFYVIFPGAKVWVIMLIIAVLSAIYLTLGGYFATARTDFVQGVIMIVGVVLMLGILINHEKTGSIGNIVDQLKAINPDLVSPSAGANFKPLMLNILLTSFGVWGLPQMVNKYYAIKSEQSVVPAAVICTFFSILIGVGAYFVGCVGRIFLNNQLPEAVAGIADRDFVVPNTLLAALGDNNLFTTIVLAIILLLLLSASMSTLSSVSLTSASAVSVDLIPKVVKNMNEKKQMRITRLFCLLFVILSFIFATQNISIIVNIMSFSWGTVAGCFMGPFIWGLFWKGTTKAGAWSGLIGGLVTVVAMSAYYASQGGFNNAISNTPFTGCTAMLLSFIIVPVVSLFTKKFDEKHVKKCFGKD